MHFSTHITKVSSLVVGSTTTKDIYGGDYTGRRTSDRDYNGRDKMMERIKNERLRIYNNPREEDKEESLFLDRLDKLQVYSKMSLKEFLYHNLHNPYLHLYDTLVDYNIIEKVYDKPLDLSSYIRFMGEYGDIHFSTGYEGFNKFKFNSLLKNFFIDQYMDKNIIEPIL